MRRWDRPRSSGFSRDGDPPDPFGDRPVLAELGGVVHPRRGRGSVRAPPACVLPVLPRHFHVGGRGEGADPALRAVPDSGAAHSGGGGLKGSPRVAMLVAFALAAMLPLPPAPAPPATVPFQTPVNAPVARVGR